MTAREQILGRIRSRLGRGGGGMSAGLDPCDPASIRPVVGHDLLSFFEAKAEAVDATVERVAGPSRVPDAIAAYLVKDALGSVLAAGSDPRLAEMPFAEAGLELTLGQPRDSAPVAVSYAAHAVAETGTVVLASGADNPATLNFLPDHHIVLVEGSRVVAYQEEVWPRCRDQGLPRSLVFITGPSRTGDIELKLQHGAHGPRHLHLVVMEQE